MNNVRLEKEVTELRKTRDLDRRKIHELETFINERANDHVDVETQTFGADSSEKTLNDFPNYAFIDISSITAGKETSHSRK